MAVTRTITRTDDVNGETSPDVEPFTFSLPLQGEDGNYSTARYTIDAGQATRERVQADLDKAYAAYVKSVRKALIYATEQAKVTMSKTPNTSTDATEIRVWARENGFTVSDRGRIPAAISEAYAARQAA